MLLLLLSILPFAFAMLIALCGERRRLARTLLALCGASHAALTFYLLTAAKFGLPGVNVSTSRYIAYTPEDPIQTTVLAITSLLFLFVSIHSTKWIPAERKLESHGDESAFMRENVFLAFMATFLGSMTVVTLASNFGLLWVAIEATTLLSAPLIIFHRNAGSIEAMWKYMLICSVGIGFALFGTMLMAHSAQLSGGTAAGLDFAALHASRDSFNPVWFKAAFIIAIAGYGTKMGLAPFHTWLPDAHSEAPATVSALLSGSLLNCSFLAITRFRAIAPSSVATFCDKLMIALGVFSVAVAAIFIVRQRDFKRMLAYSSVEHMGLVLILFALGSKLLPMHIAFHSLVKTTLFLVAGNILLAYGTRSAQSIHGMFAKMPINAALWTIGILLICGTPPSPLFITEFSLVFESGLVLGCVILFLLFIVFCGMSYTMISMTMGSSDDSATQPRETPRALCAVPLGIIAAVTAIGIAASLTITLPM